MSIMSVPFIADTVARLLGAASNLAPSRRRIFPEFVIETHAIMVPTRHGPVRCTAYVPGSEDSVPFPVYVNAHGGGFVIRYPGQDDPLCRCLASKARVVVLNVDYETAPRARFPVAIEQIYDVLSWVSVGEHRWDGKRVCAGGQSAGGALVAGAARMALEAGGPRIALQVLHYPPLNLMNRTGLGRGPEGRTVVKPWMAEVFNGAYIPDPGQRKDRLASPAYGDNAADIRGIAPALVIAAEYDPLADGAKAYAERLAAAGSLVEYRVVSGVNHGYDILGESEGTTREMYDFIAAHVARAVGRE